MANEKATGSMWKHLNSSSFQRHVEHSVGGVGVGVARALVLVVPPTAAPADAEGAAAALAALSASRSYTTRGERRMSTRRLNSSSVRRLYA